MLYRKGDTIGDLKIIEYDKNIKKYKCECIKCGRIKYSSGYVLNQKKGINHSACGNVGLKTKDPIFYQRWQSMRNRTNGNSYHAKDSYKNIDSDEFKYFIDFYDAMYDSFIEISNKIGKENTSLERIDINKSYSKENCCWIEKRDQPKNTRRVKSFKAIDPKGNEYISRNVTEFCKDHDLKRSTVSDVLNGRLKSCKGWFFVYI